MLNRKNALEIIFKYISNECVVTNIGNISKAVYWNHDRKSNFYLTGSMGLVSSVSFGLSYGSKKVICLDGDGSLLMNFGSLCTLGHYKPSNMIWCVLNNGCYETTGGQQIFTSTAVNLRSIAENCGITNSYTIDSAQSLNQIFPTLLKNNHFSFLEILLEPSNMKYPKIEIDPLYNKKRFIESL